MIINWKHLKNIYIGNNNFINNKRQRNNEYDDNDDNALFQKLEKQKLKQNQLMNKNKL